MFRGHLKIILLKALAEKESSGYDLMRRLQEKLGCKPSPGSLYPVLDEFASQGLVSSKEEGKSKVYALTAKGKTELKTLEQKRGEALHAMASNLKMWGMLSGEDVSFQLSIFERLEKDEPPFGDLSKEMYDLKEAIGPIAGLKDEATRKSVKAILRTAINDLRKALR